MAAGLYVRSSAPGIHHRDHRVNTGHHRDGWATHESAVTPREKPVVVVVVVVRYKQARSLIWRVVREEFVEP